MQGLRESIRKHRNASIAIAAVVAVTLVCCCLSGGLLDTVEQVPQTEEREAAAVITQVTETLVPTEEPSGTPEPTEEPSDALEPIETPTLHPTDTPLPTPEPSPTEKPPTPTPTAKSLPTETPIPESPTPAPATLGDLEIHFVDVGQGDAILIMSPDGRTVLVDGGDTGSGIVQYLRSKGVERLDVVVATHPHADHIGGLVDVLRAMPVDEVVTNGQPHTTLTYERFLDAIIDAQAVYREVVRGEQIRAGNLVFHVLYPTSAGGTNLNEQSVVLRLDHHEVSVLLTGDIEHGAEADLVASGQRLQAEILKVPHHGSSSSCSQAFLQEVRPEVAVYSAGAGNRYGHPHSETISALKAMGVEVYGTDVNGTVVVTTDDQTYHVTAARPGQIIAPSEPTPVPPTATTAPAATAPPPGQACPYIGNANSGVFHRADCHYVNRMAEHNKVCLQSRDEAIAKGYRGCKVCKP